ncbi:hypothetical protein IB236_12930 [Acidovorax sp. ACV02]|uniref:hypothetical protein n=1 Tax=Acidovorax sp. ACV02 TaxID=2769310 RepID=UPI0017805F17|nr:hypothetical protein [Acidovorax sp. ACV02]MBD9406245.1 hypothetical protein [Acidovorax sp. ACV02]
MREGPLPFKTPMVRATLSDIKLMTRRIVKVQPDAVHDGEPYWFIGGYRVWAYRPAPAVPLRAGGSPMPCPYGQRGDRLWVREAWRTVSAVDHLPPRELTPAHRIWYEADAPHQPGFGKLRPSMFMPRWVSRITLEITRVRVERLQDISDADCVAEGCGALPSAIGCPMTSGTGETIPRAMFRALWESINGPGSWDANPWVWVVEFRRLP